MKKINILIVALLLLIIPTSIFAKSTDEANEAIDINRSTSLSLTYKYEDKVISDINVKIYKIADVTNDYLYNPTSDFSSYSINMNGIKTNDEWKNLSNTLVGYIYADLISEVDSGSIKNNKISFNNLETGLYLVITDKIDNDEYTLMFDSFLISLPMLTDNGTWNYDVSAIPKPEYYEPKYQDITYTVIKEWIDSGNSRPNGVDIEIYKDGSLYESVTLSKDNKWSYSWTCLDDGSIYTVVERNIPEGYTVTVNKNTTKYVVVNTKEEEPPKTGDNIYIYLTMFIGSFVGSALLLVSSRKNDNE